MTIVYGPQDLKPRQANCYRGGDHRARTSSDRLIALGTGDPAKVTAFQQRREHLDPFALAEVIKSQTDSNLSSDRPPAEPRPSAGRARRHEEAREDLRHPFRHASSRRRACRLG